MRGCSPKIAACCGLIFGCTDPQLIELPDFDVKNDAPAATEVAAAADATGDSAAQDANVATEIDGGPLVPDAGAAESDAAGTDDAAEAADSQTDAQNSDFTAETDVLVGADAETIDDADAAGSDAAAGAADETADAQAEIAEDSSADVVDNADIAAANDVLDALADSTDAAAAPDVGPDPKVCPFGLDPAIACLHGGVCKTAKIQFNCQDKQPVCDYSGVANFQASEFTCDGLDNDCNGQVDDYLPAPPPQKLKGVCIAAQSVCAGAAGWQEPDYTALPNFQTVETACDGLDNDCDGKVDEFAKTPSAKLAAGVCAGQLQVCVKNKGWQEPDFTAIKGYEVVETECDNLDNDCDGATDKWLQMPSIDDGGMVGNYNGICFGAPLVCQKGQWGPSPIESLDNYQAIEIGCDGLDNNCDGKTDEGLVAPLALAQKGVCKDSLQVCFGKGGWKAPNATQIPYYSTLPEYLCDGLDNDCDGATDEDATCALWQNGGRGAGKLALSPDGQTLLWTSMTGVHAVDAASGATKWAHFGHGYEVYGAAWSPDGAAVASAGRYDALRVYAAGAQGPPAAEIVYAKQKYGLTYTAVAFSPNGAKVAVVDGDGNALVISPATGNETKAAKSLKKMAKSIVWLQGSLQNSALAIGDDGGDVTLWYPEKNTQTVLTTLDGAVASLAVLPNSTLLLATGGNSARVLDAASGKLIATLQSNFLPFRGAALQATANGVQAWTSSADGDVSRWLIPDNPPKPALLTAAQTYEPPVLLPAEQAVDLAQHDTAVWLGLDRGGPRQLNTTTGLWSIVGVHHLGAVRDLAASAGVVASAGDDTTVRLWHGATGKWLVDLLGHEGAVNAVALQVSDGKAQAGSTALQLLAKGATVATGSVDFSVRLWALQPTQNGQIGVINAKTFGLGGPWPQDLALAPGTQPALGAFAGGGQLWASAGGSAFAFSLNAANFAQKTAVYATAFGNTVESVLPSPDGKRLILGLSGGGGVGVHYRVLDAKTLAVLAQVKNLPTVLHIAAWRPDGQWVAVSGVDGNIALVDPANGAIIEQIYGHLAAVLSLAWSADGQRLLSTAADGTARVWRMKPSEPTILRGIWTRHCPAPCALVQVTGGVWLDAAGTTAVTAGDDGALMGWAVP